jgi:uroporphyrinogen-III synthase
VRLLVTRPDPDGERTAAKLRARGCEVLVAPLLQVELLAGAALGTGPWGALVMTSANAAHAIGRHPRHAELTPLPVFAVGRRTAEAARAAGFGDVTSADGDVTDLVRLIGARCRGAAAPLLYLAGEDRAGDLTADLAAAGLRAAIVVVYRAVAAAYLPPSIQAALRDGLLDGVLHFSRRSAEVYLVCAQAAGVLDRALAPFHYCLSGQVAEPLAAAGARKVRIAPRPDEAALIDLVLC